MFSQNPVALGNDAFTVTADLVHDLGTKGRTPDGRTFIYSKNGSTEIAAARLVKMADVTGDHENVVFQTAGVVGDREIKVTIATTEVSANEYIGGVAVINDGTGQGYTYSITEHDTGDGTITFKIAEPLQVATTIATTVQLIRNKYYGTLITDADLANVPIGVTPRVITASYYYWLQTYGPCSILIDATTKPTAGQPLTIGDVTSGAVEVVAAVTEPIVGQAMIGVTVADDDDTAAMQLTLES